MTLVFRRLLLACTVLLLLPVDLSHAQEIKGPIRGLISMGAYRFVGYGGDPVNTLEPLNAKPGIFGGLVVIASWKQLQPTPGAEIGPDNVIDRALAEVRAYNERNPQKPLGVKLRVRGGFEAPDWAKQLGGPPIATIFNEKPRTVGRFWSPAYRQAWARLQQQLAARFDWRPLINEVAITSCMSYTAEPFVVPIQEGVLRSLHAAGFSEQAYRECLANAVADYAPWQHSRLVLSVNPLRTGPGQGNGDQAFTEGLMRGCRQTLGRRCVFDNHDLDTELPGPLHRIYATMKQLGPEIEFQTWRTTPKDFDGTIRLGVSYGASAIELYQDYGGFPLVADARLRQWAGMLERNGR
ncbi:hypothetical protein [Reyranella sp.]|uniref:hypothetical protein n=1 Tax=Reyranella sp. TaxID=1929291 RepID=UPI00121BDEF9|nr:hypothetical protein [Reyranella sp.]TAJ89950.1 MAG: hypothetical protein EPO50_06255 [Reyranella sp.]